MAETPKETDLLAKLLAFSDGELDAAKSADVLDFLSKNPEWLKVLRDHQLLRAHAHNVIRASTPKMQQTLQQRIQSLAEAARQGKLDLSGFESTVPDTADFGEEELAKSKKTRHTWRVIAAAAVVAVLIALAVGTRAKARPNHLAIAPPAVPATLMAAVTGVHVNCSGHALSEHAGPFPTTAPFDRLADDVRQEFRRQVPYPDLTSIGYQFVGAGPCNRPLEDTVHLLYRSTHPDLRETLSILVQPYRGQVTIPAGKMTVGADADAPHPAYVWRTNAVVYFLITDDHESAEKCRDLLLAVIH